MQTEEWRGLHRVFPGSLLTLMRPRGFAVLTEVFVQPTALLGSLCGGLELQRRTPCAHWLGDVGGADTITGSDRRRESHCGRVESCLGRNAGGRVWSGRLGQAS